MGKWIQPCQAYILCNRQPAIRPRLSLAEIVPEEAEIAAQNIIREIRLRGDAALQEFALKFDRAELTPADFLMSKEEMQKIADEILAAAYALGGQAVGGNPL